MRKLETDDPRWYDRGRRYAHALLESGTTARRILGQVQPALAAMGACTVDEAIAQFTTPDLAQERAEAKRAFVAGVAAVALEAGALAHSMRGLA